MSPIGFALLTHDRPERIARLVARLDAMFDTPPIACHHDFDRCPMDTEAFGPNVAFVRPHVRTQWGGFSLVEATLRALRLLYASPRSPEWFVLLSGADYPIKPAARILRDLREGGCDAHIEHRLIDPGNLDDAWCRECHRRYFSVSLPVPWPAPPGWRGLRLPPPVARWLGLPFSRRFRCHAGAQWFSANHRAAGAILEGGPGQRALARHYRHAEFPSESFFHTLLAHAPGLRLSGCHRRYTDWSAGGSHPKTLGLDDLPALAASPAHFARKVDPEKAPGLIAELDRLCL
jgi:hypothetical protein